MIFPYISMAGGQGCPPTIEMYGKIMIFKMQYLMTNKSNLLEILKNYCRLPYLQMI